MANNIGSDIFKYIFSSENENLEHDKPKDNPDGFDLGGAAFVGSLILSNVLHSISGYQAANKNYKTVLQNASSSLSALEENIALIRRENEQTAEMNRAQIAASGIKSSSFSDVLTSNKIIEENDVAVLRANTRGAVFNEIKNALDNKYTAKKRALWGSVGAVAGGIAGAYTGSPAAVNLFSHAGASFGQGIGGANG